MSQVYCWPGGLVNSDNEPLSPALSPLVPRGEREKNLGGRVTQDGARASLVLGYYQVIPTGFRFSIWLAALA
jgi:hypothetical protein